ncbi:hypothetical protein HTS88_12070 [Pseudarthrobacter oxydans]|nr:hypothetical protein [Pseudarthrobacter oxydans]
MGLSAAVPARATSFEDKSDNWSGVIGKPKNLGSAPVDLVQMEFVVPILDCKRTRDGWVSIWAGMDSASSNGGTKPNVTQAGIMGRCVGGAPHWNGWYQAHPDFESTQMPGMPPLRSGQHIWLTLLYYPYPNENSFRAEFSVRDSGVRNVGSSNTYFKIFETQAGATQRARAECIVERPTVDRVYPKLAKFSMADKTDFTAGCWGGGTGIYNPIDGLDIHSSNALIVDMWSYWYNKKLGIDIERRKMVNTSVDQTSGKITWKWLNDS